MVMDNVTDNTPASSVMGVVYVISTSLVMVTNLTVITVVIKSHSLHLPTLWNIAFMAVWDFSYGLAFFVFVAPSTFLGRFAYSNKILLPVSCLLTLMTGQNIFNILLATIDRYLSVMKPFQYHRLMTSKRFIIANSVTMTFAIARMFLIAFREEAFYNSVVGLPMFRFSSFLGAAASTGLTYIIIIFIIGLLLRLAIEIRLSRRHIHPIPSDTTFQSFTFSICLSAVVFCISYVPMCVTVIIMITSGIGYVPVLLQQFTIISVVSNSIWNVVIYAVVYTPFRKGFLRLFFRSYYRHREQLAANVQRHQAQ